MSAVGTKTPTRETWAILRSPRSLAALIAIAVLAAVPLMGFDNYVLRIATTILMYATLAWAWNLIGGFAGYPSFGIAAFFGFGAYTGALLLTNKLMPFWCTPIAGAATCFLVAVVIGTPILRLRGHYFAVASLGVGEVFRELAMSWTDFTGGGMGVNLPPMHPTIMTEPQMYYCAMLAVAVASFLVTVYVARSRLGVALRCIRQNEAAASMIGINTTRTKIVAFALSAALPGAAGAVYAPWIGYIDPSDVFNVLHSIKAPVMVLLGGMGTIFGPLIGAVVYLIFEEIVWSNLLEFHNGMLGIIVALLVLFMPNGILDVWRRRGHKQARGAK